MSPVAVGMELKIKLPVRLLADRGILLFYAISEKKTTRQFDI